MEMEKVGGKRERERGSQRQIFLGWIRICLDKRGVEIS